MATLLMLEDQLDPGMGLIKSPVCSIESYWAGRRWVPRPTDVVCSTFPKSGTTYITNVCHQLRSRCGANEFDEICEVVPWIDTALDTAQDLQADHAHAPRVFKSHANPSNINSGCKRVLVVREPGATALSFFSFLKDKKLPMMAGITSVSQFIKHPFWVGGPLVSTSRRGNVWEYMIEIWFVRLRSDTLVIPYESIVKDPTPWVKKIGEFMSVPDLDEALVADVVAHSTKAYMLAHETQFDDHWIPMQQAKVGAKKAYIPVSKVTSTKHAKPDGFDELMQEHWTEYMTPVTGHATYADMVADLAKLC